MIAFSRSFGSESLRFGEESLPKAFSRILLLDKNHLGVGVGVIWVRVRVSARVKILGVRVIEGKGFGV
jgi:hypothetical protein